MTRLERGLFRVNMMHLPVYAALIQEHLNNCFIYNNNFKDILVAVKHHEAVSVIILLLICGACRTFRPLPSLF